MQSSGENGPHMPITDSDVYQQDAEFCRYQDQLRWSRFRTASLIEAGLVYATWVEPGLFKGLAAILLTSGGFLLVVLLSILSQLDESDYASHLKRLMGFETGRPFVRVPARFVPPKLKGSWLMPIAWLILHGLNVLMIAKAVCPSMW